MRFGGSLLLHKEGPESRKRYVHLDSACLPIPKKEILEEEDVICRLHVSSDYEKGKVGITDFISHDTQLRMICPCMLLCLISRSTWSALSHGTANQNHDFAIILHLIWRSEQLGTSLILPGAHTALFCWRRRHMKPSRLTDVDLKWHSGGMNDRLGTEIVLSFSFAAEYSAVCNRSFWSCHVYTNQTAVHYQDIGSLLPTAFSFCFVCMSACDVTCLSLLMLPFIFLSHTHTRPRAHKYAYVHARTNTRTNTLFLPLSLCLVKYPEIFLAAPHEKRLMFKDFACE